MKSILIIGLGLFGQHAVQKLAEDKHEIMAVDIIEERVNSILPYVTGAQIGDSTNADFLKSLGVDNYDLCIVTIGDDFQASLETTSLLKEFGAVKVVSRASSDIHEKFLLRNGADEVIYPEKQLAEWAATRYTSDHILDFIQIDSDHSIFELTVPYAWHNKTIIDLNIRKKYNINIIAVKENGKINMTVSPDFEFAAGQSVLVVGRDRDIEKYFHI